ncbi:MAG: hypothetical protein ACI4D0_09810 [Lachnospira sp.]
MEVDVIILPKEGNKQELQFGMKQAIIYVFKKIYDNVQNDYFQLDSDGEKVNIKYQLSSKNDKMVFAKFQCEYTPSKSAKALDCCINKLINGEHRKDWNIVISYDEVSQLYCCKLMPLFGTFERRTRELVYITIIKIFGVEWYEKSFSESLQNTLKGKGNKTKLVEGALNELTYEQLKEYLFVPYSSQNLSEMLDEELAKDHIEKLSKEEIVSIIDKCRNVSLWDRFFGKYKKFQYFKEKIDELQPYRNIVMHNKRVTQQEYNNVRKSLKSVNKLLTEAINVLEEDMYTETRLIDVVSALGNMLSNILGNFVPKWTEKMKPALASFGKIVIEAAMPKINIPDIMPALNLGANLSQHLENVYNVSQMEIPAIKTLNAFNNSSGVTVASEIVAQAGQMKAIYQILGVDNMMAAANAINTTAVRIASEKVAQAGQMKAIYEIPGIDNMMAAANAINTPAVRMASEIAAQANCINAMYEIPAIQSLTESANALNSYDVEFCNKKQETNSMISED